MSRTELTTMFEKSYPDFSVMIMPPCISDERELQYCDIAKAVALGLQENDKVVINKENKEIIYFR